MRKKKRGGRVRERRERERGRREDDRQEKLTKVSIPNSGDPF